MHFIAVEIARKHSGFVMQRIFDLKTAHYENYQLRTERSVIMSLGVPLSLFSYFSLYLVSM